MVAEQHEAIVYVFQVPARLFGFREVFFFNHSFYCAHVYCLFHFYARSQAKLFNRTIVNSHAHTHTAGLSRL